MRKSPSVAYYIIKIRTTPKSALYAELEDAPLRSREYAFISDIIEGLNMKELSDKYNLSQSRIAKWKREIFEKMHSYDMACIRR